MKSYTEYVIGQEGLYIGMPEDQYRAANGVNQSSLKEIRRSPSHYLHSLCKPNESTPAMVIGTLLHARVLEPERRLHVVKPDGMSFVSKEGKAWKAEQTAHIISRDDDDQIHSMCSQINAHPIATMLLSGSHKEVAGFRWHKPSGLYLKGRLDIVGNLNGETFVADIKTTEDASAGEFVKTCMRYGYARQAAYYCDLAGASKFYWIAVEKSGHHGVQVFALDAVSLARGRQEYELDLEQLGTCHKTNVWGSYTKEIKTISIP